MWEEYWQSKGFPIPLFQIGDEVQFKAESSPDAPAFSIQGFIWRDKSWVYFCTYNGQAYGFKVLEGDLKAYVQPE